MRVHLRKATLGVAQREWGEGDTGVREASWRPLGIVSVWVLNAVGIQRGREVGGEEDAQVSDLITWMMEVPWQRPRIQETDGRS